VLDDAVHEGQERVGVVGVGVVDGDGLEHHASAVCRPNAWRTATLAADCSTISGLLLFGCIAKRRERLVPERVEVRPQVGDRLRVDLVDAPRADLAVDDEAGVLEDLEVLRDRRPADRQLAGELADRPRPLHQALEDGLAGRVAEGGHRGSYVRHG
jgi:hypothetical protein